MAKKTTVLKSNPLSTPLPGFFTALYVRADKIWHRKCNFFSVDASPVREMAMKTEIHLDDPGAILLETIAKTEESLADAQTIARKIAGANRPTTSRAGRLE